MIDPNGAQWKYPLPFSPICPNTIVPMCIWFFSSKTLFQTHKAIQFLLQVQLGSSPMPSLGVVSNFVVGSQTNPLWQRPVLLLLLGQLLLDLQSLVGRLQKETLWGAWTGERNEKERKRHKMQNNKHWNWAISTTLDTVKVEFNTHCYDLSNIILGIFKHNLDEEQNQRHRRPMTEFIITDDIKWPTWHYT